MSKVLLRIAGGIDVFFSCLLLLLLVVLYPFSLVLAVPTAITVITGAFFLYLGFSSEEEIRHRKGIVLLLSILAVLMANLNVGALGIAVYLIANDKNSEKKVVDKQKRKLSVLLTLGVLLIMLAGVVFATSTWESLSGLIKTCVLIFTSLLFFGISGLAENKLKLVKSSAMYYLLGSFFAVASYFSAGFFELFGNWFSMFGIGKDIFLASVSIFTAVMSVLTYLKYRNKKILYIVAFGITMAIVFVLSFVNVANSMLILGLLLFFGGVVLITLTENLNVGILAKFSKFAFVVVVLGLIQDMNVFDANNFNLILTALSSVWASVVFYALAWNNEKSCFRVFAPILSFILLIGLLLCSDAVGLAFLVKLAFVTFGIFAIGFMKRDDKVLFNTSLCATDIVFAYMILDAIRLNLNVFAVVVAVLFVLVSFIVFKFGKVSEYHFERFLEPIKVFLLILAVYELTVAFTIAEGGLFFACVALMFAVVQIFKRGLLQQIYFWFAVVSVLLSGILNVMGSVAIIMPALLTVALALLTVTAYRNSKLKYLENVLYALFWVTLFIALYRFTTGSFKIYFYLTAFILLNFVFALIFRKNNMFKVINLSVVLFPMYAMVAELNLPYEYSSMISAVAMLLLFIGYSRGMLKGASVKFVNVMETILIGLWFLALIFEADVFQGIIIGIVAILFVIIGYRLETAKSFYYTGIAATILNLWKQLVEFWNGIPFWAYMLLAGFALVGFVTYQEYRCRDKEKTEVIMNAKDKSAIYNISTEQVISGTVIYLLVFLSVANMIFVL